MFVLWVSGGCDRDIEKCCQDNAVPAQCLGYCRYEYGKDNSSTTLDEPINPGYPTVCEMHKKTYDDCWTFGLGKVHIVHIHNYMQYIYTFGYTIGKLNKWSLIAEQCKDDKCTKDSDKCHAEKPPGQRCDNKCPDGTIPPDCTRTYSNSYHLKPLINNLKYYSLQNFQIFTSKSHGNTLPLHLHNNVSYANDAISANCGELACKNGGTCEEEGSGDGSGEKICKCEAPFIGKQCEVGKF